MVHSGSAPLGSCLIDGPEGGRTSALDPSPIQSNRQGWIGLMISEFCKEPPVAAGAFLELLEQVCREFVGGGPGVTSCPLSQLLAIEGDGLENFAFGKFRCENRLERFKGRWIRGCGCSESQ